MKKPQFLVEVLVVFISDFEKKRLFFFTPFLQYFKVFGFDIVGFQCGFEHCIIVAQCNQFDLCRFEFAGRIQRV